MATTTLKIILTMVALCLTYTAQAATVTHNGYTLNTETNIVTGGGLRWLQWDETNGLTTEQAMASYPRMRLASNAEMANLFNAFNFGGIFDADVNTGQSFFTPYDSSGEGAHEDFVALFGVTFSGDAYGLPDGTETLNAAYAYFDGSDGSEVFHIAIVHGDAWSDDPFPLFGLAGYGPPLDPNSGLIDIPTVGGKPDLGFVLVAEVPLPTAAWLFGSALLGLGAIKRKKA